MSMFLLAVIFFLVLRIGYVIGRNEMKLNSVSASYVLSFGTRQEAENVLAAMEKYIQEHNYVTVRYVANDLTGQPGGLLTGCGMGWNSVEGHILLRDQYNVWWLCLPNPRLVVEG